MGRKITSDFLYCILASVITTVMTQFIINPILNQQIGTELFGNMLFYMAIINAISIAIGVSLNNIRLITRHKVDANNKDYILLLLLLSFIAMAFEHIYFMCFAREINKIEYLFLAILLLLSSIRQYSTVEFRMNLNYKGSFIFGWFLIFGNFIGLLLFHICGYWQLIFMFGEIFAIGYVYYRGSVLKKIDYHSKYKMVIFRQALPLLFSYLITNLILNLDRFILHTYMNDIAVAEYYTASLLGKTVAILSTPLNSIISGYLTKDNGKIKAKSYTYLYFFMVVVGFFFWIGCSLFTPMYIKIMYPNMKATTLTLILLANLAQILYFLTDISMTVVLTIAKSVWQFYIQVFYGIFFVLLTILFTKLWGVIGFAIGSMIVNFFKLVISFMIGKFNTKKEGCL